MTNSSNDSKSKESADKSKESADKCKDIDTSAPQAPTGVENLGTPGVYDGFGAADKCSDSDSQPPVQPPAADEPVEAFRDPVKEGV